MSDIRQTVEDSIRERVRSVIDDDALRVLVQAEIEKLVKVENKSENWRPAVLTSTLRMFVERELNAAITAQLKVLLADETNQRLVLDNVAQALTGEAPMIMSLVVHQLLQPVLDKLRGY